MPSISRCLHSTMEECLKDDSLGRESRGISAFSGVSLVAGRSGPAREERMFLDRAYRGRLRTTLTQPLAVEAKRIWSRFPFLYYPNRIG